MTEYELGEVISNAASNGMTSFTIWLSIASGYLVAAYSAGANLTTIQVLIVNILYFVCSVVFASITIIFVSRGVLLAGMKQELFPDSAIPLGYDNAIAEAAVLGLVLIMVGGILATLYFMWNVRHSKAE